MEFDINVARSIAKKAYDGIRAQGGPSLNRLNGSCAYRGIGGTKCGIGWLIPDDKYNATFDDYRCDTSAKGMLDSLDDRGAKFREALIAGGVPDPDVYKGLIKDIQLSHDYSKSDCTNLGGSFIELFKGYFEVRVLNKYLNGVM